MGSAPNQAYVKELEKEAYSALLRALYLNPSGDRLEADGFLLAARTQLHINNDEAGEILNLVRTDLELIRSGRRPQSIAAAHFTSPGSLPPGRAAPAAGQKKGVKKRSNKTSISPGTGDESEFEFKTVGGANAGNGGKKVKVRRTEKQNPITSSSSQKQQQKNKNEAERPIGAPGSSRPRSRPSAAPVAAIGAPGGGNSIVRGPPPTRQPSLARPRSTRSMGSVDPNNYVHRRIWRWYPNEDPEKPWVEGFIFEYEAEKGTYRILYDPNDPDKQESIEEGFNINIANPAEFVLGDYFDLENCYGSRRQAERPNPIPLAPPTAQTAPAKRRRSVSIKVPPSVPFPPTWLETAVLEASIDDLHVMLNMLEMREGELLAAIDHADMALRMGGDLEKRAALERQFEELCGKEIKVMDELKTLKNVEL